MIGPFEKLERIGHMVPLHFRFALVVGFLRNALD